MQRTFRSFRESFRRKRDKVTGATKNGTGSPANQWHSDEIGVRQGNCTFPIKYLGCVEVFESRGMPICEEALKVLRGTKRKAIRGTLFVSGDGLRVVDGETRGLIVDQTIEKVSFCAPDRNNERGFAYICRDGTTRRWMCHGFHAVGNTGERLSHAVGCAFAICLERKQKREQEAAAATAAATAALSNSNHLRSFNQNTSASSMNGNISSSSTTTASNSNQVPAAANQAPVTATAAALLQRAPSAAKDPQVFRFTEPPPMKPVINPYAIDRPHATPLMLQRQTSFRQLSHLRSQTPFKRQLSLKLQQFNQT